MVTVKPGQIWIKIGSGWGRTVGQRIQVVRQCDNDNWLSDDPNYSNPVEYMPARFKDTERFLESEIDHAAFQINEVDNAEELLNKYDRD